MPARTTYPPPDAAATTTTITLSSTSATQQSPCHLHLPLQPPLRHGMPIGLWQRGEVADNLDRVAGCAVLYRVDDLVLCQLLKAAIRNHHLM